MLQIVPSHKFWDTMISYHMHKYPKMRTSLSRLLMQEYLISRIIFSDFFWQKKKHMLWVLIRSTSMSSATIFLTTSKVDLYHSLGHFSRQQTDDIFPIFPQETGTDSSWKSSLMKTICMRCQIMFPGKKYFKCNPLKLHRYYFRVHNWEQIISL